MEAKHAPAPWSVSDGRTVEGHFMVVGGEGFSFGLVAECIEEADAHLTAASPELLEALKRLHTVAEMTTFSDQFPGECEAARAAIAKAEA